MYRTNPLEVLLQQVKVQSKETSPLIGSFRPIKFSFLFPQAILSLLQVLLLQLRDLLVLIGDQPVGDLCKAGRGVRGVMTPLLRLIHRSRYFFQHFERVSSYF